MYVGIKPADASLKLIEANIVGNRYIFERLVDYTFTYLYNKSFMLFRIITGVYKKKESRQSLFEALSNLKQVEYFQFNEQFFNR